MISILPLNILAIRDMIIFPFRRCLHYNYWGIPVLNCVYIRQEMPYPITKLYYEIIILITIQSRSSLVTGLIMVCSFTNTKPGAIDDTGIWCRRGTCWLCGMDNMCCNRNGIFSYHENCKTSYIFSLFLVSIQMNTELDYVSIQWSI